MENKMFEKLNQIIENSSSKYYNYPVAAILECTNGKIFSGVNIETSSPAAGVCAERNAISTAIAEGEKQGLVAISIYSPKQRMCVPCGACLQWLAEFRNSDKDVKVILEDNEGNPKQFTLSEFLPYSFKIK